MKEQPQIWTCGVSGAKTVDRRQVQMVPCWLKGVSELGSIRWGKSRTNGKGIRLDFHWGRCIAGVFTMVHTWNIKVVMTSYCPQVGSIEASFRALSDSDKMQRGRAFLMVLIGSHFYQCFLFIITKGQSKEWHFNFWMHTKKVKDIYTKYIITIDK